MKPLTAVACAYALLFALWFIACRLAPVLNVSTWVVLGIGLAVSAVVVMVLAANKAGAEADRQTEEHVDRVTRFKSRVDASDKRKSGGAESRNQLRYGGRVSD